MLVRLIYASKARGEVDPQMVHEILKAAHKFNKDHNITGMLCEGGGQFIQYIEGDRADINELYNRLLNDRRHEHLVLLDYSNIDKREYQDWSMGFVSMRDKNTHDLVLKATDLAHFTPEKLTAAQAYRLVHVLKSHNPTQLIM